jgi:hypothetical protein
MPYLLGWYRLFILKQKAHKTGRNANQNLLLKLGFCMRFIVAFLFMQIGFNSYTEATTLYSRMNGNWSQTGVWSTTSGGNSCNCTPIASDNVVIYHHISMDKHLTNQGSSLNGISGVLTVNQGGWLDGGDVYDLDMRSTGSLDLCGNLNARNVIFSNGCIIVICSTGIFTIAGDFENKNNGDNVTIDGQMNVYGSFENGNGGEISGTGVINFYNGPVTNIGTTMGYTNVNPCADFPCTITSMGGSLPVELVSFKAETNISSVILKWITYTEVNNDFFEIEKSPDGISFMRIGFVKGNGNSTREISYSFIDESPQEGKSFYRLKQNDFNGATFYSDVITVNFKKELSGEFYPNRLSNGQHQTSLNLSMSGLATIYIYDLQGRCFFESAKLELTSGKLFNFSVPDLPPGYYQLTIKSTVSQKSFSLFIE